jgi:hypothetical protein
LRAAAAAGDTAQRDRFYEQLLLIAAKDYMLPSLDALVRQDVSLDDFLTPMQKKSEPGNTP